MKSTRSQEEEVVALFHDNLVQALPVYVPMIMRMKIHNSSLGPAADQNPWRNFTIGAAKSTDREFLLTSRPIFLILSCQSLRATGELDHKGNVRATCKVRGDRL